jgi:hypothetical protein
MKMEECLRRGRNASRGSVGRGQLRCEGELLREGLLDEGNFVARVFDEK